MVKIKRRRKPMTPEQKAAAIERLAKARLHSKEGYGRNMQHYLKHGDWIDNFYGEYEEKKVQWRTIGQ